MILLQDFLISEDIFDVHFVCNLNVCKGACCVEGDKGAPLHPSEIGLIENNISNIVQNLPNAQKDLFESKGFYEEDDDGELITTCLPTGECVFSKRNAFGVLECEIEKSFISGKSNFKKPLSCHLYPIRVSKIGEYTALNYHKWDICNAACNKGKELQVPLFEFLKDALIRSFGEDFYTELKEIHVQRQTFLKDEERIN
jgi:hypothetical protein